MSTTTNDESSENMSPINNKDYSLLNPNNPSVIENPPSELENKQKNNKYAAQHIDAAKQFVYSDKQTIDKFVLQMKKQILTYMQQEEHLIRYFCVLDSEKSPLYDPCLKQEFEMTQIRLTPMDRDILNAIVKKRGVNLQFKDMVKLSELYVRVLQTHAMFMELMEKREIQ